MCRDGERADLPVPRGADLPLLLTLEGARLRWLLLGDHFVDLPNVRHPRSLAPLERRAPCDASTRTVVGRMPMMWAACSELYPKMSVSTIAVL